jgi:sugar phosphate isomerase/epimerase
MGEWLERFATRIIGTHLHDVVSTNDHYAAGLGNANFDLAAAQLPHHAFRTCEFQNFNSLEQVKTGLEFLVKHNCIKTIQN